MHKKNVEIYHSGWLVKSPPNHRGSIFKARWRRRWFTLKQGELPGQFFLEYFTDSSCRKRKGIIDLDQVEQVDAGLRLDRATIKFPWMFDMKTPNRTYYLAADDEQNMRDWVMVICQVCNLQETEERSESTAQYYNVGPNNDFEAKEITQNDLSTNTDSTLLMSTNSDISEAPSNRANQTSIFNEYENEDVIQSKNNNRDDGMNYSNLVALETSQRTSKSTGAIKKIPENLKLRFDDKINNNNNGLDECTSNRVLSGPYIPLSDCFSGSPVLFKNEGDPKTPLNSLDPKFYDNPRSHITNIGLNLTDDQPNSPKKTNLQQLPSQKHGKSANSSPTDSDGSTDDEWNEPKKTSDRKTRPSDSSMENEAIIATAGQSYMKMTANNPIPLPPKRISLVFDRKLELSDTEENVSPIIGPKDKSSFIDDSYDFPRSHNIHHMMSGSHRDIGKIGSSASIPGQLMTSTPNLIHNGTSTLERNFYGNAAPRERNVFVFDQESISMPPPPEVNRTLKPRKNGSKNNKVPQNAPVIDRKLKPSISKPQVMVGADLPNVVIKRRGPETISLSEVDDSLLNDSLASNQSFGLSPKTPDRLQYLDLDHTSSPQKSMLGSIASTSIASNMASLDISLNGSIKEGPGVAYTTVDFLKTDAFNRVREDSEMTRASKSRIKN